MSHIQYPFTSGAKRGVTRTSRSAFAHSCLPRSQTVVEQPFEQKVQMVSTTLGLSHGRDVKR